MDNNIEKPIENDLNSLESSLKDRNFIIKIVAGVIGLVLISGGVVLGARLWDPIWNPFRPSPEKVLARVADKMNETKSLEMKMTLGVATEDGGFSAVITTQTEGDKSKGDFEATIEEGIIKVSISGEFAGNENESFVKLNKLPDASLIGMDFSFLTGTWIKLAEKQESDLDEESVEKLTKLIDGSNLLIVNKELPNEKMGKTKVYHYILGLDKVALRNVVKEAFNSLLSSSDLLPAGLVADTIPEKELDDMIKVIGDIEINAWIGIKDNLFYKIAVEKEIINDLGEKAFFNLVVEFSKFNEPVAIEMPSDYSTIEEIMMPLMFGGGSSFDRMRRTANDFLPILNLR